MGFLFFFFIANVLITAIYKYFLSSAKRDYNIHFEGMENTFVEARSSEIKKILLKYNRENKSQHFWKMLLVLSYLNKWLWIIYMISIPIVLISISVIN